MSIDLNVYLSALPKDWIELVTKRLLEFGLECEVHPEYEAVYETHSGFLPIKMKLVDVGPLEARGKYFFTGFECVFSEFDYSEELTPGRELIKDEITDDLLRSYSKVFAVNYYSASEDLIAYAFCAVLTELVSGLFNDPQADSYMPAKTALDAIANLIDELPVDEMVPFEGWIE